MSDMGLIPALRLSASALDAQSHRMRVIAANVANAHTTQDEHGDVYRRKEVVFATHLDRRMRARRGDVGTLRGVHVAKTVEDPRPFQRLHRPGHPLADEEGYVTLPNVNPMEEMVDMMVASRAYEANVAAMRVTRSLAQKALEIGK